MRTMAMVFLVACASDEEATDSGAPDSGAPADPCRAEVLEDDFTLSDELGPAGDPASWPALPPDAVVATTYLRLLDTAEGQAAFGEAIGPVIGELSAPAAGLMGLSLASSAECGTARTLSVWESDRAMTDFVVGPAHGAAITRIGEISRGGSITMIFLVSELPQLAWTEVAARLADHQGPVY